MNIVSYEQPHCTVNVLDKDEGDEPEFGIDHLTDTPENWYDEGKVIYDGSHMTVVPTNMTMRDVEKRLEDDYDL